MTEFSKGDKVKAEGHLGIWTISMIEGGDAWCKNSSTNNHLTFRASMLTKLPNFFEAHKRYRSKYDKSLTFDCHYVGYIGAPRDGRKYAAGQKEVSTAIIPATLVNFSEWEEV